MSRRAALLVLFAWALVPPRTAHPQSAPTPEAIVAELDALPWGVPCARWAPDRGTRCDRFRGDGATRRAVDLWCDRSDDPVIGGVAFFHVLDPEADPPACGLSEVRWSAEVSPARDQLGPAIERRLTVAYGQPERPDAAEVDGSGTYWWQDLRRFRAPWGEVLLYDDVEPAGESQRVHVRARSRERVSRVEDGPGYESYLDLAGLPDPDSLLVAALDGSEPGVGLLATPVDAADPARPELDALAAATRRVEAGGENADTLLLLSDRLTERLSTWASLNIEDTLRTGPVLRELERTGVELTWNPLGYAFTNPGSYLWRLWRTFPDRPLGQLAFAELLASGWDTSGMCAAGKDQFREVIPRGRAFLAAYPDSPVADYVVWTLALAQETWWSLSRAEEGDPYVEASEYRDGADEARKAAIDRYIQVLAADPSPGLRAYATERLALLRLGADTNQRAFLCVYD